MADPSELSTEPDRSEHPDTPALRVLEWGDGFAHYLLAGLILTAALAEVLASTYRLVQSIFFSPIVNQRPVEIALPYLGDLLFALILLEILSTLITYIKSKKLEATIKDFLIIGMISSIRKLLLVGAQSAITESHADFVQESLGTAITIVGILLLIGGLLLLERRNMLIRRSTETAAEARAGPGGV